MTREGPPLGSGRRTGLPLVSGGRGAGGAGAGMLGGPLGWGRRGSAPRAGRDPRLPVCRERGAGAQGEGTQGCRARPHSRSAARGWARPGPGRGRLGSLAGRPLAENPGALGRGPGQVDLPPAGPRTWGISVRGRLDTSSFYLDTASLFQPAGTCTVLS